MFSTASGCRSFVAGCIMMKKKRSYSVKCAEMRVLLERLINKYSLADVEEAILIEGKKTRASFMQFKYMYFLNSNREKSVIKLCETPVELDEYQEIFAPFVTLAQIFVTIPVTSVPCERGFSAQNRVHSASRNRLNPVSVESKMHTCIMHSSKRPSSTRKVSAKGQLCTLKKSEKGGNSLYADNL